MFKSLSQYPSNPQKTIKQNPSRAKSNGRICFTVFCYLLHLYHVVPLVMTSDKLLRKHS